MKLPRLNVEFGLVFLAFLTALIARLANLSLLPLSETEALNALQMFAISKGNDPGLLIEPGLVVWGSGLFFLFGSGESIARLIPAFTGALLVFTPLLFKNNLGKIIVPLMAFFLALDPGLIAVSRQVDGRIIGLTFWIFALGFYKIHQPSWAGICFALALLGGPAFWLGALIFSVALGISLLIGDSLMQPAKTDGGEPDTDLNPLSLRTFLRKSFSWFAGTVLFAGSLFLLAPQGWSGIAGSFVEFLRGGALSSGAWFSLSPVIIYSPLAVLLGIVGAVYAWIKRDVDGKLMTLLVLCGLLVILIYQGHQVEDLIWVLVPLWALAARGLHWILAGIPRDRLAVIFSLFVFVLLVFGALNFIAAQNLIPEKDLNLRYFSVIGAIFLLVSGFILVAWGWSLKMSLTGLANGLGFFLVLVTLANSARSAGTGPRPELEIWNSGSTFLEADLFLKSVGDVSEWKTGRRDWLDIQVDGINLNSIKWLLRNQTHMTFSNGFSANANPSIVITNERSALPLKSQYSGQDFGAFTRPSWSTLSAGDWMRWMIFREAPKEQGTLILWVRSDLFPGITNSTIDTTSQ